jgi:L-rhamnose mutarotase
MRLKPGKLAEYKKHHDGIWPEMIREIEKSGIASITIFENDPHLVLFSEITDVEAWNRLWHSDVHEKWGKIMEPLMHLKSDGMVDFDELREVFHVETSAGKHGAGI